MRFSGRSIVLGVAVHIAVLTLPSRAFAVEAGDVALISFASDNPDSLAFVVLQEIPASTTIRFTDSGWFADGGFRANEGGIEYTTASMLSPGTVISRTNRFTSGGWSVNNDGVGGGGFALSASGDQIIAFIGSAGSPTFIHAVHFDSTGYVDAVSSNTTALPTGLIEGETAVNLGETDNGYYNGPTSGTPIQLLPAIGNPLNWVIGDNLVTPPTWSFTVGNEGPKVQDVSLVSSSFSLSF